MCSKMKIYPFIDGFYRKATVTDGYNTRLLKLCHAFKEAEHVVTSFLLDIDLIEEGIRIHAEIVAVKSEVTGAEHDQ